MKIKCAAICCKTGRIFEGRNHAICFQAMKEALIDRSQARKAVCGFVTDTGKFVGRKEAGKIAFEAGQTPQLEIPLFSEDLTGDWPWNLKKKGK